MAALNLSEDLLLCNECGTQFDVAEGEHKDECKVCDDPRQYVPATGQQFTTLRALTQKGHKNVWWQDKRDPRIWSVKTEPSFAIGNRAELIQTPKGNILMDLIPFLDQETVDRIESMGGLEAIVISHPHYYSTWADWSRTFKCPIYVSIEDKKWFERVGTSGAEIRFFTETYTKVLVKREDIGMTAIVAGGHFPGSLVVHWENILFIADTIFTSPSGTEPVPGRPGKITFNFFWSIPNRIPLHPDDILAIWNKVKPYNFNICFGAFKGMDVYEQDNENARGTGGIKGRLLESCKIFIRTGTTTPGLKGIDHPMLNEKL